MNTLVQCSFPLAPQLAINANTSHLEAPSVLRYYRPGLQCSFFLFSSLKIATSITSQPFSRRTGFMSCRPYTSLEH